MSKILISTFRTPQKWIYESFFAAAGVRARLSRLVRVPLDFWQNIRIWWNPRESERLLHNFLYNISALRRFHCCCGINVRVDVARSMLEWSGWFNENWKTRQNYYFLCRIMNKKQIFFWGVSRILMMKIVKGRTFHRVSIFFGELGRRKRKKE